MKPEIQTRHDALRRHAMLLALLVTLAIAGVVALQSAADRPPSSDAPAEHRVIEPFAPPIDAEPAWPNGRAHAIRTQIAGRVRWTDGSPAVGAGVRSALDGESAATCSAGRYTLPATPVAGTSSGEIVLSVHPPCWSTPIERSVAVRSADPGTFEVDDIVLPDEVDVAVDIKVTEGAAAQLATVGYGHIEYALHPIPSAGPLPATIGSARADLVPGLTQASLRVPYRPAIAASSRLAPMEEHRGLPRMHLATGSGLVLRRDAIARDTIVIDERCLLVGRTIGSDGRGIAGAKVKLLQSTPTGKSVFFCTADDQGAFVYIGSPGEFWTVQASCQGVESAPVAASVGGFPVELLCRTESLRRLLVRDGEKPILRYQMGRGSLTFGQAAPPWLPEHPEGVGLFPLEAANVYLCWLDRDGVLEAEVSIPAGTPDVVTEIDVASLPRQSFGLLQLQFGDFQGILTLTALAAPSPGLHPLRASFSPSDRGPRLGMRPGRYRLGIKRGFFAGEERSIELELTDGRNDIDVGGLLR